MSKLDKDAEYFDKHMKICPVCGKKFFVHVFRDYLYKISDGRTNTYYCSYTCWDQELLKRKDSRVTDSNRAKYLKDSEERLRAKKQGYSGSSQ